MKSVVDKLLSGFLIVGAILFVIGSCGLIISLLTLSENSLDFQIICLRGLLIILITAMIYGIQDFIKSQQYIKDEELAEKFRKTEGEKFEEDKRIIQINAEEENKAKQLLQEKETEINEMKRLEDEQKQLEYKKFNEEKYLEVKSNPEIVNILGNYFSEMPISIFLSKDYYNLFEYLLLKDYDIARKVLWSSESDLIRIENLLTNSGKKISPEIIREPSFDDILRGYINNEGIKPESLNEVDSFIKNDFSKLKRLVQKILGTENDNELTFTLLRLLQIGSASYFSQVFSKIYNIDFDDIDKISLEECLFIYYKSQSLINSNIYEDPAISLFAYYLISNEKFGEVTNIDYYNFLNRRAEILEMLEKYKEEFDFRIFESNMTKKGRKIQKGYSIQDVDLMGGAEFEQFVAKLFEKMGYRTKVTKHSGDFGVDVIAEKDEIKVGIQAKCYVGVVPNSAIQEIVAGINHYKCDRGIVVTNSAFTKAAIELAKSNSIQLWDRKILEEKIIEIFHE